MKRLVAIAFLALAVPAAYAQSRDAGNTALGQYRSNVKPASASAKDLDRAKRLADQARARLGVAAARKSAWAYGGR